MDRRLRARGCGAEQQLRATAHRAEYARTGRASGQRAGRRYADRLAGRARDCLGHPHAAGVQPSGAKRRGAGDDSSAARHEADDHRRRVRHGRRHHRRGHQDDRRQAGAEPAGLDPARVEGGTGDHHGHARPGKCGRAADGADCAGRCHAAAICHDHGGERGRAGGPGRLGDDKPRGRHGGRQRERHGSDARHRGHRGVVRGGGGRESRDGPSGAQLRHGKRRDRSHVRRDDGRRCVLLGQQRLRPARRQDHDGPHKPRGGPGRARLCLGDTRGLSQLWRDDGRRRVLLGQQRQRPARRRHHDEPHKPRGGQAPWRSRAGSALPR